MHLSPEHLRSSKARAPSLSAIGLRGPIRKKFLFKPLNGQGTDKRYPKEMGKKFFIGVWVSGLVLGLALAIPTVIQFSQHQKARSLATQGCESWWLESKMIPAQSLFSKAAHLDPAYIPLATAGKTLVVDRPTAKRFGYEQQWLDGLHTFQGFCEIVINPNPGKE